MFRQYIFLFQSDFGGVRGFSRVQAFDAVLYDGLGRDDRLTSLQIPESLRIVRRWFNESQKSQPTDPPDEPYHPRRLIDVSTPGPLDFPVKLCSWKLDDEALQEPVQYTTLSHRWGHEQKTQTTCATIENFGKRILFSELPKTFQDAVTLTRVLKIPYLWIDALCILQDSRHDWAKEAALMANTYGSAAVNIAAHPAQGDQNGFLASKYTTFPKKKLFQKQANVHRECDYLISRFERLVNESLLSSRGWVFQERLLSPQTLHCVGNMLFWEDHRGFFAEDESFSDAVGVRSDWRTLRTLRDWYKLMETYSRCDLTMESDRLPAIAGLAASFQEFVQSPYYAGVWGGKLPLGLLWLPQSRNPNSSPSSMGDILVPTWSWAHYGCPIRFINNPDLIPLVQFVQFLPIRKSSQAAFEYAIGTLSGEAYLSVRANILWMNEIEGLQIKILPNGLVRMYSQPNEASLGWLKLDQPAGLPGVSKIWLLQIALKKPKDPMRTPCYRCELDPGHVGLHFARSWRPARMPCSRCELDPDHIESHVVEECRYPARIPCSKCELDSDHVEFHTEKWNGQEVYVLVLTVDEAGCYRRIGLGLLVHTLLDSVPYSNIMIK